MVDVMTMGQFFAEHFRPVRCLGLSAPSIQEYATTALLCNVWWARPIQRYDLTGAAQWLQWLRDDRHIAHSTTNKYRRYCLSMLRHANTLGITSHDWLDSVPRLPEVLDAPEAWLLDEVEALLAVARRQPGVIVGDVPARNWWPAMLLTLFDCGSRISATMALRSSDFDPRNRTLSFRAATQKQRRGQRYRISDQTTAALAAIHCPHRELLFAWPFDQSVRQWPTLTRCMRRLIDEAGLVQPKKPFHKLRATSGSLVEEHGGSGATHLGHSSARIFDLHYRDSRIVSAGQVDRLPRPRLDAPTPDCGAWYLD